MVKILVLHFGGQCPWHEWQIEEVKKASEVLGCSYSVIDVEEEPELAEKYKMFFPFMMVIGDKRVFSPTKSEDIIKMVDKNEN
ncbi:MAG: hypothetical protein ACE5K0_07865 [Candidatus Methanofastidiosia archaeon]